MNTAFIVGIWAYYVFPFYLFVEVSGYISNDIVRREDAYAVIKFGRGQMSKLSMKELVRSEHHI